VTKGTGAADAKAVKGDADADGGGRRRGKRLFS
jgi:hypothetical protein